MENNQTTGGGCNRPEVYKDVPKEVSDRVQSMISDSKRFLFMKGNPESPLCGFSAQVAGIIQSYGKDFKSFDILSDQEIRYAVKIMSDWPTFPQLYVNGQLVGGCDVITDLHEEGELEAALD